METDINSKCSSYEILLEAEFKDCVYNNTVQNIKLIYLKETDSTNNEISRQSALYDEGLTVVASSQKSGQGRYGRSFYSPDCNSLYMSILLRPDSKEKFDGITIMAAVATAKAINELLPDGDKVTIKWVNDLIFNNKKVGGIIAKAVNYGKDDMYVILGIGVNVFCPAEIPDEIMDIFTSLFPDKGEKSHEKNAFCARLCGLIIKNFFEIYNNAEDKEYIRLYRDLSCVIGKSVTYLNGNEEQNVFVRDIDDEGSIVLEGEEENIRTYRDGEIRIRL